MLIAVLDAFLQHNPEERVTKASTRLRVLQGLSINGLFCHDAGFRGHGPAEGTASSKSILTYSSDFNFNCSLDRKKSIHNEKAEQRCVILHMIRRGYGVHLGAAANQN